jgi:uncharacterized alkaline shock family protein YloU
VISNEVLAAIAVTAARDVEGVSAIVSRSASPAHLLKRDNLRFVKITGDETQVSIELLLRLRASAKLTVVSGKVQRAVKDALQGMTNKTVARVNLKIIGVDF